MTLREAIDRQAAAAGPEALQPNQLQAAHELGRTVVSVILASAPLIGAADDSRTTLQAVDEFKGRLSEMNPILPDPATNRWQFLLAKAAIGGSMSLAVWLLRKHHQDRMATITSVLGLAAGEVPAMLNRSTMADARARAAR